MMPPEQDLGIVSLATRISAQECLRRLNRRVLMPFFGILVAGYALIFVITFVSGIQTLEIDSIVGTHSGMLWKTLLYAGLFAFGLLPLAAAGLYLTRSTRRWRIWALQNAESWLRLEEAYKEKFGKPWPRVSESAKGSPEKLLALPKEKLFETLLIRYRDEHDPK